MFELELVGTNYSNLIGLLKHVLLMGKVSDLILQIQFFIAIGQPAGLSLGIGSNLWKTAIKLFISSQITRKLCLEELPHIAR